VKLRKLSIATRAALDNAGVVELLSVLRSLSELTSLRVGRFAADAVQKAVLDGLSAAVPHLREITLFDLYPLPPLTALSACTQLRTLRLTGACERDRGQSCDDILQLILSLPHLEFVEVDDRCNLSLTAAQRVQFTPPSAMAPSLKIFDWRSYYW
jgi:hypothetical protein